ncbi:MAG TPA: putative toxin-antitoxin system toxin component, PIN family [Usitatibacteraceae bacterium]|nr:putative toxin-antitoxin system toxin component, PIN family [Usitatibacteraceae bacterium]
MRIVLDTSVLVAALRSRRGASNELLRRVAQSSLRPLVSTALFLEYEDVISRAEQRLATGMSERDIESFLAALASACDPVEVHFRWRPQLSDPSDELVLEAAVNGMADALVTHNVRDFQVAAERFDLRVLTPQQCLKEMKP